MTSTLQDWIGSWKELKQWCLYKVTSTPLGAIAGAIWFRTDLGRAGLHDGTKPQLLAHVEDVRNQAGMVTMPTITVTGFNITVGNNGVVRAYDNANWAGIAKDYRPTGGTFALNQNADNLLIYTAGVGYSIGTTINDWNLSNKVVVTRFVVGMGRVHRSLESNLLAIGQCEQVVVKEALTSFYQRVGNIGLGLTVTGLVPEISAAEVYSGPTREQIAQFTTATGTLYQAQVTGTTWTETAISAINTTIYNPSTGVAELPPSKWAWAYIYRTIGNDIEAYVRYGEEYFSTDTAALKGFKLPSTLDIVLAKHSMLVGYVLFKKGDTSIPVDRVFTPWDVTLSSSGVSLHESLPDLQGGVLGEHVHLTIEEKAIVATASTTFAPRDTTLSDEVASTTLPSTGLATLVGLLQTVRNCLKYLVTNALDKITTTAQSVESAVHFTGCVSNASALGVGGAKLWAATGGYLETNKGFIVGDSTAEDNYVQIKTNSRNWWVGVGASSGDDHFVIYNSTNGKRVFDSTPDGAIKFLISPSTTSNDTSAATTAWASPRVVVITSAATLPANASIGTSVFAEAIAVSGGTFTVTAPSGTVIAAQGSTSSTHTVGTYRGVWFVKTSPSRWAADSV